MRLVLWGDDRAWMGCLQSCYLWYQSPAPRVCSQGPRGVSLILEGCWTCSLKHLHPSSSPHKGHLGGVSLEQPLPLPPRQRQVRSDSASARQ